jgi:hypothetical protein
MAGGSNAMRLNPVRWALLLYFLNRRLPAMVFIYSEGY